MGLVRKLLYAPALGKTYRSKADMSRLLLSEIARYGNPRSKILWLTPLRSLRWREAKDLEHTFNVPRKYINILPSKEEAGCHLIRSAYSPILSLAICPKCSTNCWYRYIIKDFLESDSGIWIGTHHFLPFAVYGKCNYVVVDEYDALIPYLLVTTVHEDDVKKLISAGLITEETLKKMHKKRLLYKWEHIYWIPMRIYFADIALYSKELRLLSATPPPREFDFMVTFYNPYETPDEFIDEFEMKVDIKEEVIVPESHRIQGYALAEMVYMSSVKRRELLDEAGRIAGRLGGKTTIIVGSKDERERLYSIITRRYPNLKVARDTVHEYGKLEDADIRVIVVGGLINRGWNLESDYVIAFWQYMRPEDKRNMIMMFIEYLNDINEWNLIKYMEYRKHVQTLFRCIRSYDRPHTLLLIDSNYYHVFHIFRTLRFMWDSVHFVKNLKDALPSLK